MTWLRAYTLLCACVMALGFTSLTSPAAAEAHPAHKQVHKGAAGGKPTPYAHARHTASAREGKAPAAQKLKVSTLPKYFWTAFWTVLVALIFYAFCMAKIYSKAGYPAWAALVPFYNLYIYMKILGRPIWWMIAAMVLSAIPVVGALLSMAANIVFSQDLARAFGKSKLFGVGLCFLGFIFLPLLAFGDATYQSGSSPLPPANMGAAPRSMPASMLNKPGARRPNLDNRAG